MAFVPYYNRRGYNDGLSKVAEAALLNIENEICDKVITEQILCKLIADLKDTVLLNSCNGNIIVNRFRDGIFFFILFEHCFE